MAGPYSLVPVLTKVILCNAFMGLGCFVMISYSVGIGVLRAWLACVCIQIVFILAFFYRHTQINLDVEDDDVLVPAFEGPHEDAFDDEDHDEDDYDDDVAVYLKEARRLRATYLAAVAKLPILAFGMACKARLYSKKQNTKVKAVQDSAAICTICLEKIEREDQVYLFPQCDHFFHVPCVHSWLCCKRTCPLCRSVVIDCSDIDVDTYSHDVRIQMDDM